MHWTLDGFPYPYSGVYVCTTWLLGRFGEVLRQAGGCVEASAQAWLDVGPSVSPPRSSSLGTCLDPFVGLVPSHVRGAASYEPNMSIPEQPRFSIASGVRVLRMMEATSWLKQGVGKPYPTSS